MVHLQRPHARRACKNPSSSDIVVTLYSLSFIDYQTWLLRIVIFLSYLNDTQITHLQIQDAYYEIKYLESVTNITMLPIYVVECCIISA